MSISISVLHDEEYLHVTVTGTGVANGVAEVAALKATKEITEMFRKGSAPELVRYRAEPTVQVGTDGFGEGPDVFKVHARFSVKRPPSVVASGD